MTGLTATLAERASGLHFKELPPEVVEVARHCLLDWLGCTLAGSREEAALIALDEAVESCGAERGVTVVGRSALLPIKEAALVNGTASHALDYDDVQPAMIGHPSVPIWPGLLALAEHTGASGEDVVSAFVAGYETECRVGLAVGRPHYLRGFHATGTAGTFGAAAACARLLGLGAEATARALALAGTQAAGLKSMFGTMAKPLHAGRAAANGLLAARLAERGFTGHPEVLEVEQGFAATLGEGADAKRALRDPPGGFFLPTNLFKHHAACFQTHSSIEGLRRLREAEGLSADDIDAVTIHATAMQMRMCAIPSPVTGLEAKFSLRHTAAFALAGIDTAAIETFTDSQTTDPPVVKLRDRIEVVPDGESDDKTVVDVVLRDGRRFTVAHDVSQPETDLALQRRILEEKFLALAAPVVGRDAAPALAQQALAVAEAADIRGIMFATRPR